MEPTEIQSVNQFRKFVTHAKPGQTCRYHRGYLYRERSKHEAHKNGADNLSLIELADFALHLQALNLVALVQKRHGYEDYSYLAIRGSKPAGFVPDKAPVLEAA